MFSYKNYGKIVGVVNMALKCSKREFVGKRGIQLYGVALEYAKVNLEGEYKLTDKGCLIKAPLIYTPRINVKNIVLDIAYGHNAINLYTEFRRACIYPIELVSSHLHLPSIIAHLADEDNPEDIHLISDEHCWSVTSEREIENCI